MVDFSITRILFINALYSLPIFLMYRLSNSISYILLMSMFLITYSLDLYFNKFITKFIHLIVLFLILIFMISFMYKKSKIIDITEYIIIFITMSIGLYYLVSILRMDNNYTFNKGYLIFTGISFLYFSSLPGLANV